MRFVVVRCVDRLVDIFGVCGCCGVLLFDDLILASVVDDAINCVNEFGRNFVLDNFDYGSNIPFLGAADALDSCILFSGNLNDNGNGFVCGCGCCGGVCVDALDVAG